MANFVYIATSLDGHIATLDGGIEWLTEIPNPANSDYGFAEFMNSIDALVMGRKTYETVLTFDQWPYTKRVFVLSNTLKTVAPTLRDKAEIINGELKNILTTLHERGFKNLYIDGGKTIQGFLKENLIDELIVTKIPIILGDGIPLFQRQNNSIMFRHYSTTIYNDSLVKSHYKRA
ncbi:MAG: diacylglycerol kinase [Bdellovibrionales bacterium GWA2_49_15]|nr:MAG: diacylglycerol kinase [Bdellovibrionales bacterium GWA2_49_15]HAZ12999.1 diacylglycerol kinase [Bdellovibrionales bacterium]